MTEQLLSIEQLFSPIISNGMIIQRDTPYPIWSKKNITVSFLGRVYEAASVDGKWLVTLNPVSAGGPFEMEINCDNNVTKIQDIYAGDVWLCSGQSNMEMLMDRLSDDYSEEWKINDYPLVRQFKAPQEWDFSDSRDDLTGGSWLPASSETLSEFGAVPWFFSKNLFEKYKIPIGLITTAWGGTPIESWMSCDALASFPEKLACGKQYADDQIRETITNKTNTAINDWETNLTHEDIGISQDWKNINTDISSWNDITLPGDFADAGLKNFCGVVWLAKDIEMPEDFNTKTVNVWLGTIIDSDIVYLNGEKIGDTGYRYPPRKYTACDLFKKGKNRIVIRVTCNNGEGSVTDDKPFRIFTENNSFIDLCGTWKYKVGANSSTRPEEFFFQRMPLGNFNAIIAPVLKFPLKGVIWYQGESNGTNSGEYEKLFQLMIQDWRKKNKNEKLPFLFVQLPVFNEVSDNNEKADWAILREAQKNALSLPFTGMACALELGEWNDIHPLNKKDVGYRLFLAAEKTVFGINNSSPGPMVRSEKLVVSSDNKIIIQFNNCAEKLITKENLPQTNTNQHEPDLRYQSESSCGSWLKPYITILSDSGSVRLPAEITAPDTISIDISSVKNPQKILYAWADNPKDRQLFNSDGLPMIPFKIEIS